MSLNSATQNLRQLLLWGGVSEEEFASIQPVMRQTNARTFVTVACLCVVLMLGLFIASFCLASVEPNRIIYLVMCLVSLALGYVGVLVLRGRLSGAIYPYVILTIGFIFGMVLGLGGDTSLPAVTFMVLLIGLPLLVIDQPYRVCILILLAALVMILCTLVFKSGDSVSIDIVDAICFGLLAMVANVILTRSQIVEILHRVQAERESEIDALTGLRNANAYRKMVAKVDAEVKEGIINAYGVVVTDVNNLKGINDSYGHAVGDELIRAAGRIVCKSFAHSPVMRIGGDEFVAILKGQDYENRNDILAQMRNRTDLIQLNDQGDMGEVSIAVGMGIYQPDCEMCFAEVFHEADAEMYENKKEMKAQAGLGPVR